MLKIDLTDNIKNLKATYFFGGRCTKVFNKHDVFRFIEEKPIPCPMIQYNETVSESAQLKKIKTVNDNYIGYVDNYSKDFERFHRLNIIHYGFTFHRPYKSNKFICLLEARIDIPKWYNWLASS